MPRSWHSLTSYLSCMPTGSPHFSQNVGGLIRIGDHRGAAVAASGAQVVQPLQVAALAFPVSNRIVHEIQLRQASKILDRKNRREHGLQPAIFAFRWKQVHLKKSLIGFLLNFDQVRNLNGALDFREIQPFPLAHMMIAISITISIRHTMTSRKMQGWARTRVGGRRDTATLDPGGT